MYLEQHRGLIGPHPSDRFAVVQIVLCNERRNRRCTTRRVVADDKEGTHLDLGPLPTDFLYPRPKDRPAVRAGNLLARLLERRVQCVGRHTCGPPHPISHALLRQKN